MVSYTTRYTRKLGAHEWLVNDTQITLRGEIGPTRPTHFINRVQLPAKNTTLFTIINRKKSARLTACSRVNTVSVVRSFCVPVFSSVKIKAIRTHISRQGPRRMSSPISNSHQSHATRIGFDVHQMPIINENQNLAIMLPEERKNNKRTLHKHLEPSLV